MILNCKIFCWSDRLFYPFENYNMNTKFEAGINIAIKIPKNKYEKTVSFYRDILKLEVEEKPIINLRFREHMKWNSGTILYGWIVWTTIPILKPGCSLLFPMWKKRQNIYNQTVWRLATKLKNFLKTCTGLLIRQGLFLIYSKHKLVSCRGGNPTNIRCCEILFFSIFCF